VPAPVLGSSQAGVGFRRPLSPRTGDSGQQLIAAPGGRAVIFRPRQFPSTPSPFPPVTRSSRRCSRHREAREGMEGCESYRKQNGLQSSRTAPDNAAYRPDHGSVAAMLSSDARSTSMRTVHP